MWLPLSRDTARHLGQYLSGDGAPAGRRSSARKVGAGPSALVFPGVKTGRRAGPGRRSAPDRPLTDEAITRIWYRTLAVGLKCSPHQGRHWFATRLAREGVAVLTISRLMRHSNVSTTDAYLHSSNEEGYAAIELLDRVLGAPAAEEMPAPAPVPPRPAIAVVRALPPDHEADPADEPDQDGDREGTNGVVALLEWASGSDRPVVTYLSSADSPGDLAALIQYVLRLDTATWEDPGLFAAELVNQVASSGAPYRLSAVEPDFDGRVVQVDVGRARWPS